MSLTVLSVAYPHAPVGRDAVGGSEQVLHALDRALVDAGHTSIVVAVDGSSVAGALVDVPRQDGQLSDAARQRAWTAHRAAIAMAMERWPVDLVHLHGLDFSAYLPPPGPPVLATLHLPPAWYSHEALFPSRPDTWLNCVSDHQHGVCPPGMNLVAPVHNGVPVAALQARHARRGFALALGRVCPEKGLHLAIDAAKAAGIALILAGEVFPYADHQSYFRDEIAPRLDAQRKFVGALAFARKRRLLTAARCLLVPSLVNETSSLVAREAAACGTPVIAFRRGALSETVEDGRTGFLVDDAAGMTAAIGRVSEISAETCRETALRRFSNEAMTAGYLDLYARLTAARRIRTQPRLAVGRAATA